MLELHTHTTFSDGVLTPTQLVEAAIAAGVRALAITDHDTLCGWDEADLAAVSTDLAIVPGVELSTVHNDRSLHILGFYGDREALETPLQERLEGRKRRAYQIIQKLADLGYPLEMPLFADGIAPSRPHIARALHQAGYVNSPQEAFQRWLGDDGPAYVHYEKFSAIEGIHLLRSAGAVAVWAHPYLFRGGEVEQVLPVLVDEGLQGIEVYHPHHSPTQREKLLALAKQYNLLVTGGSDFHGTSQGSNLNQLQLPLHLLDRVQTASNN